MPFVPAPNIVSCEIRALFDGQQVENRINIDVGQSPTEATCGAVADIVGQWVIDSYAPLLPSAVVLREVYVKSLESQEGAEATYVFDPFLPGGRAEAPMPNETTLCLSLRSGSIGRSARGRTYVLGICKVSQVGNNIVPVDGEAFRSAFDQLRVLLTASELPYQWVIVSYRHNKAPRPGGPVYYDVRSVGLTDFTLDSQRRRKPGNGT